MSFVTANTIKILIFATMLFLIGRVSGASVMKHLNLKSFSSFSSSGISSSIVRGSLSSVNTRLFSSNKNIDDIQNDNVVARCTKKINDALEPEFCKVTAANDDPNGSHIKIECISNKFEGKNTVQRQRLVFNAIWDELSGPVHAVDSIFVKTPSEIKK